ncbi:myosin-like protein [Achlya hypogyna]|uniref:Myosin-like protein n=1 Tax=Achlya hypogyna TaxID=1202772 RepID=A0A1V9Z2X7_ACHHY|nr:myosin-like protein [Achlya hypogyna]
MSSWIHEQAAEYADLVNDSSFASVSGLVDDDPTEYQLIWEGGDLGVALTTNPSGSGVSVSRITGKGFPQGIKSVVPGDVLLAVNELDTLYLTLEDVVKFLQECDLPATLRLTRAENVAKHMAANPRPSATRSSVKSRPSYQRQTFTPPTKLAAPAADVVTSPTNAGRPSEPRMSERPTSSKKKGIAGAYGRTSYQQQQQTYAAPPSSKPLPKPEPVKKPTPAPAVFADESDEDEPIVLPTNVAAAPNTTLKSPFMNQDPKSADKPAPKKSILKPAPHPNAPLAKPPSPIHVADKSRFSDARPSTNSALADSLRGSSASSASNATAIAMSEHMMEKMSFNVDDELAPAPKALEPQESAIAMMDSTLDELPILDNDDVHDSFIKLVDEDAAEREMKAELDQVFEDDEDYENDIEGSDSEEEHVELPPSTRAAPYLPEPRDTAMRVQQQPPPPGPSVAMSSIHDAAAKGDLRTVLTIVRQDKSGPECLLRREPNHGHTALHLAVKSGNVPLVQMMLDQFAGMGPSTELLSVEDDKGNTALHFAATKTPHMVHLLLENGAPVNVKNSRGLTPLVIAILTNKKDDIIIVNMLLKYGANPNEIHETATIVHTAINMRLIKVAGALVKAGAKLDVEDSEGKNVFEKCSRTQLRYLLSHIYYPPTFISEKERSACMLCLKKIGFGHRKHNCTHCGRLCCSEDAGVAIPFVQFPQGFPGRIHKGAGVLEEKRCCKTCFNILRERANAAAPKSDTGGFVSRVIGVEWDEVNPNKLQKVAAPGRRRG